MMAASEKQKRLEKLTTSRGTVAAIAIDQRRSLRGLMAAAAGVAREQIPDEKLVEFKRAIADVLSPYGSAILFDPEYGMDGAAHRDPNCGLLLAYELDGYENPRPHRMLALMPHLSVRRLAEMGADGVKILLHYAPHDDADANEQKRTLIERIGDECVSVGLPFFFEPVVYDPDGTANPNLSPEDAAFDYAKRKPEMVVETMREFAKPRYNVDILKVEFPVVTSFVEGSDTFSGRAAYSKEEAMKWFQKADAAANQPYIYLSAGVKTTEFFASIRMATEAKTRFSGVLCGRATWQDSLPVFMREGREGLYRWLETQGATNIQELNKLLESATPIQEFASARKA
ncbi:MAG: tagatose 1,6-diphosphate aldolase [Acidobacteria bacterium]|nr:tagatose 1,6-diphosphate aldolase [Acidobacteriota bacterium]